MNGDITRISLDEAVKDDRTDWQRVRALTDDDIDAAIAADPDTFALDAKSLKDGKSSRQFIYFVYSEGGNRWRWRLQGSDGQILAYGAETFDTLADATRALRSLRAAFRSAKAA